MSALPSEVAAFVHRVARKTRLRRAERADVERELGSHFEEALAAGRTPGDAIAAFGDPKDAARALRSAAIAKRSPLDRAFGQAMRYTGYLTGAFVLAYVAFAAHLWLQSPVISVDSLARFRERLAVPQTPDEDAWPLYRKALVGLGQSEGDPEANSDGFKAVSEAPRPGDPQWDAAVRWVDAHRDAIADLRAASQRPVFGFPAGRELDAADEHLLGTGTAEAMRALVAQREDPRMSPMFGVLLPQLGKLRAAARVLHFDAMLAAEAGDGERAVADLAAMMAISVHVQDGRILIGDLVGIAIRSMARTRAIELLEWKPNLLDAAQLERLQRAMASVPSAYERLDMGAERLMWIDLEQRLFTDDGQGNGWFRLDRSSLLPLVSMLESTSGGMPWTRGSGPGGSMAFTDILPVISSPAAALMIADRRETRDMFEEWAKRFEEASALPMREEARIAAIGDELTRTVHAQPIRFLLPRLLMPALSTACFSYAQDRAWATAATTACAAARFHRDKGAWPTCAEDLVPRYMASVPEDPWTGSPVRMAGNEADFRIWSVGRDGVDDRGDLTRHVPEFVGQRELASTTNPNVQIPPGAGPTVDWVWFAPRGNLERWKER